jgi:hypothetical protein
MPPLPKEGFTRVRLIGGRSVHLARADQFVPDEDFASISLKVTPELLKAVALCGQVGERWIEADIRDTESCAKCEAKA